MSQMAGFCDVNGYLVAVELLNVFFFFSFLIFRIFDAFSFCFHFSVAFVDFPPSPDYQI